MKNNKANIDVTYKLPTVSWFQTFDKVYLYIEELYLVSNTANIQIFFKKMTFIIEKYNNNNINYNNINYNSNTGNNENNEISKSLIEEHKKSLNTNYSKINKYKSNNNNRLIKFEIDFFSDVFKDIVIDNSGRYLKLIIKKKESQYWPRLTREKESFSWIKINRFNYIEESDDDYILEKNSNRENSLIDDNINYEYNNDTFDYKTNQEIKNFKSLIFDKLNLN